MISNNKDNINYYVNNKQTYYVIVIKFVINLYKSSEINELYYYYPIFFNIINTCIHFLVYYHLSKFFF